jgi:hypothetical protein
MKMSKDIKRTMCLPRGNTRDPLGRRQMRASYSMYPVPGSTCDRKFRIASWWSTMLDGRPSDDAEENP